MFCKKCGEEMPDDAIMCVKCGNLIEDAEIDSRSFSEKKEKQFCRFCGQELDGNAVVCTGCGRLVTKNKINESSNITNEKVQNNNNSSKVNNLSKITIDWILNTIALVCVGCVVICGILGTSGYYVTLSEFYVVGFFNLPVIFGYVFCAIAFVCQIVANVFLRHEKFENKKYSYIVSIFVLLSIVLVAIMTSFIVQI